MNASGRQMQSGDGWDGPTWWLLPDSLLPVLEYFPACPQIYGDTEISPTLEDSVKVKREFVICLQHRIWGFKMVHHQEGTSWSTRCLHNSWMSVKTRSPPYPVQKPAIGKSQSYSPDPSIPSPHVHAEPLDHVSDTCVGAGSLKLGLQKTVPRYRDTCYAPRWGTVRDPALPRWNPPSVDNTGTVAEPFLPHSQHLSYPNPSIDHHHYQPWPTQMCWTPMAKPSPLLPLLPFTPQR